MKIFIIRFHSEILVDVARELAKRDFDIAYWVGSKKFFESARTEKAFEKTIFHNTLDAAEGKPAPGIEVSRFEPVSKELAAALLPSESQVLTMMNSIDTRGVPFSKRKHMYYRYLTYWNGVLEEYRPDAIVFGDIPHIAFQYVLYCLAKHRGIKTILYKTTNIPGRIHFFNDFTRYENLRRAVEETRGINASFKELSSDLRDYYKCQTESTTHRMPFYVTKPYLKRRSAGSYPLPRWDTVLRHIQNASFFGVASSYIQMFFHKRRVGDLEGFYHSGFVIAWKERQWNRMKKTFKKEYERLQISDVDLSKKFVYVALHNQPECSTSAMGDIFVDQLLMIDIIRASVPDDWIVYVKESPLQWSGPRTQWGRYKGYYEEIAEMKNVYLIPVDTPSHALIEKAQTVATVTGSVSWESVLRGKPALVFGYPWYMYCDGIFRVDSPESCREAIERISHGQCVSKQSIINFLATVDKGSVRGFSNMKFKKGYSIPISEEENTKTIAEGFYRELMNEKERQRQHKISTENRK